MKVAALAAGAEILVPEKRELKRVGGEVPRHFWGFVITLGKPRCSTQMGKESSRPLTVDLHDLLWIFFWAGLK